MPKVEIKNKEIRVGSKKIPLLSGEMHYWRLPPQRWRPILDRVRELGINIISTYVPWNYHEIRRGSFDFTGKTDPSRDLKGFLEMTRREKFWVILRPGPYIYSEWPNEGVPDYAFRYHRLHPAFLKYAKKYLQEAAKIFRPFLASRQGGHILMIQADNEIDPWPDRFGEQYGLNSKPGLFQSYLSKIYHGDICQLNNEWGTDYRSFHETGPFISTMFKDGGGLVLKGDKELRRSIDYFEFKYFYSEEYARWALKTFRELKIEVPLYLNLYPFFYAHDWTRMQTLCDLVGVDLYPSSEFSEDPYEQRKLIDKVRYLKSTSQVPFIAEFAAGVWHARHYETGVVTPNHYRLITLSALLGGAAGWNWYMLVNRDNWYASPINEWGRIRSELYEVFKELVSVYRKMDPPSLTKLTDTAVTYIPIQYAARTLSHNHPVLSVLYDADIDYELFNPELGCCSKPFLFYSGNQWLDAKAHWNLRKYVERGGTLVAFRDFPRKNERFESLSVIGFEEPASSLFEFKKKFKIQFASNRPWVDLVSSVYSFKDIKAQKIQARLDNYGVHTVGYIKKIGTGRLVHLGFDPTIEFLPELFDYLKINIPVQSSTAQVKTSLFRRGRKFYLVVVNNGEEAKSANIRLEALKRFKGKIYTRDLMADHPKSMSPERRNPFMVDIPRKDGRVFEFTVRG